MSISCVMNRRSIREYTDQSISNEEVDTLLKAGMFAPSAMNSQPWEFLVVRDPQTLEALSEICEHWWMLKKAPLAILVMANLEGYKSSNPDFFIQDCAASTENMLVCAEGMGLGGVWLGLYGRPERMEGVAGILRVPENILPFSLLSIGHPAVHPQPHAEMDRSKIHYEIY